MICVTGVSGSGKSTLINDTLVAAAAKKIYGSNSEPAAHEAIEGLEHFDKVINVIPLPTQDYLPLFVSYLHKPRQRESVDMMQAGSHLMSKAGAVKPARVTAS
jgi:hypothetical protein